MKPRTCERCGKTKGVTFHAMQTTTGKMRSVCAHLACFKRIREDENKRIFADKLLSVFKG